MSFKCWAICFCKTVDDTIVSDEQNFPAGRSLHVLQDAASIPGMRTASTRNWAGVRCPTAPGGTPWATLHPEGRYEVTHAEFDTRSDEYQRDLHVEITQNVSNFSCGLHQNAKRWLWFIPLTFFCTNCHKHTNMGRVYF